MAPTPPLHSAEPDIREHGQHLRPDIYRAVESMADGRIKRAVGLSGFQPPAVVPSPSAAGEAAAAASSPIYHDETGKEITRHQAVRQNDPGSLQWNSNTAWRWVRSESRGGSPAAAGGSSAARDTAAAADRHLSFGSGAADSQQRDAIRLCQSELLQPLYPASSGNEAEATAYQPLPRPPLLLAVDGLLPGAGKPCGVRPAAAAAPAAPSGAGPDTAPAPATAAPQLDAKVKAELAALVGTKFHEVAEEVERYLRGRPEFAQLETITAKDVATLDDRRVTEIENRAESIAKRGSHSVRAFIKRLARHGKALQPR